MDLVDEHLTSYRASEQLHRRSVQGADELSQVALENAKFTIKEFKASLLNRQYTKIDFSKDFRRTKQPHPCLRQCEGDNFELVL